MCETVLGARLKRRSLLRGGFGGVGTVGIERLVLELQPMGTAQPEEALA